MRGDRRPFTVGVTGLRDLGDFDIEGLRSTIRAELEAWKRGHDTVRMLNSIAAGADQLCAGIAISLEYELVCPLPFAEYRDDFHGETLTGYDKLLSQAKDVLVVSDSADKDAVYLAAGRYVADHCDVLLAVWDGRPQGSICGTAAVVSYAKELGKEIKVIG